MSNTNSKFTWSNPVSKQETVTVTFEGENCTVPSGVTVAAALLGHDDNHFCRSAAENDKRAPYCLMGVCFECLVEIDGQKNKQACLEPVYDGMTVQRQNSPESEKNDEK